MHPLIDGACIWTRWRQHSPFAIWQVLGAIHRTNADVPVEKAIDRIDVSHLIRSAVTGSCHRSPGALALACGGLEDVIESEQSVNLGGAPRRGAGQC